MSQQRQRRRSSEDGRQEEQSKPEGTFPAQMVSINSLCVSPKQPRRYFDPDKLDQLVASIQEHGILEPLIVRPLGNNQYEIVAGERRYRAAKEVRLEKIPVVVRELDEDQAFELALLENLQRDDLNPIDETEAILKLLSQTLKLSTGEIVALLNRAANAQKRGQPLTNNVTRQIQTIDHLFMTVGRLNRESFRTNRLPLLNLPEDVLEVLRQGELEYTKGKAIARVPDADQRKQLMQQVIEDRLSLSELKRRIKELQAPQKTSDGFRNLHEEFRSIMRLKTDAWEEAGKRQRLTALLAELKEVLGNE